MALARTHDRTSCDGSFGVMYRDAGQEPNFSRIVSDPAGLITPHLGNMRQLSVPARAFGRVRYCGGGPVLPIDGGEVAITEYDRLRRPLR